MEIDGRCVQKGGRIDRDIRKVRSQVGFVFQQFNLVARLPVLVNVLVGSLHRMPWWRSWMRLFTAQERALALEALARVGIADCYAQRASTLSGGQQQRAAIARTLVQGAKVVLADEPIASLDPESSRKVMEILARINREDGCTVIVSLHQVDIAMKYCPRVVALRSCSTARRPRSRPSCCASCTACRPKSCCGRRAPPSCPRPRSRSPGPGRSFRCRSPEPHFFRPCFSFRHSTSESSMIKKLLAALAIGLGMTAAAQAQDAINFGIISTEATQNLKGDWQPLIDDMSKQTGLKVTAFFAPDYAGIIEAMRFNKVQLGWFGNKSAMEAVDRASGEVFAQMVNADGTQGYYSHLIVNRESPLNTLDDVLKNAKNLSFGNGDPNSTSGYLVPGFYVFAQNKVDAKTIFKITRSANHETNALAVANKQVDVATNNSENLEKVKERFPEKFKDIKIVWTSPLIPLDPLVMRKDLPEATKAKLRNFFFNYAKTDAREKEIVMKISKLSGFKESSDKQLLPIRQIDLFGQRTKIEADTVLSDADKKAKLADIDKKLAALN